MLAQRPPLIYNAKAGHEPGSKNGNDLTKWTLASNLVR